MGTQGKRGAYKLFPLLLSFFAEVLPRDKVAGAAVVIIRLIAPWRRERGAINAREDRLLVSDDRRISVCNSAAEGGCAC